MYDKLFRTSLLNVLLHASAWAIIFFLPLFIGQETHLPKDPAFQKPPNGDDFRLIFTLTNITFIPLFYMNALVLVPRFFNRKKWPVYLLSIIVCIILIGGINISIRNFLSPNNPFPLFSGGVVFFSIFILITSTAFHYIWQNIAAEKLRKEKEAENLKTELSFLRSQVSPHFLFNTLNNLVSLARKKSDLLEPSLLKLSGLLQYMLYESDDERIDISKEIEYLDNYIDLQKLRFGDGVQISFTKQVPLDSMVEVVPMILIPFVENAFKHGVVLIKEPEINISLIIKGNILHFKVENRFNTENEEKDKSSGIGLSNVKRRLNLLYPDAQLEIAQNGNWYVVNLSINL